MRYGNAHKHTSNRSVTGIPCISIRLISKPGNSWHALYTLSGDTLMRLTCNTRRKRFRPRAVKQAYRIHTPQNIPTTMEGGIMFSSILTKLHWTATAVRRTCSARLLFLATVKTVCLSSSHRTVGKPLLTGLALLRVLVCVPWRHCLMIG